MMWVTTSLSSIAELSLRLGSKNPKSAIARVVNEIRTLRRIVLTGTPMQNNLKEYYAMVNFCKPNYLGVSLFGGVHCRSSSISGTEHEFSRNFRIPIEAGQHKDSSPADVAFMRRRAFALNQRLKTVLHRRDFDVLRSFLPPKFEYGNEGQRVKDEGLFRSILLAVKIKCQPLQQELYRTYLLIQDIDPTSRLSNVLLVRKHLSGSFH